MLKEHYDHDDEKIFVSSYNVLFDLMSSFFSLLFLLRFPGLFI